MSDEIHMQVALRHAEHSALLPWQSPSPDEELMAKEDAEEDGLPRRAWLQEVLLTFLFADAAPDRWENVALRALAVFRHCLPGLLVSRDLGEVEALNARRKDVKRGFPMEELVDLSADEDWREILEGIMVYLFPAKRKWLFKGTQRAYLLAKAYQPHLVTFEKWVRMNGVRRLRRVDLSYEDLAEIFEGKRLKSDAERDRSRSRWSARAQAVLRRPIEECGGTVRLQFGKSSAAREAMARSAAGNCNRRGNARHQAQGAPEMPSNETGKL